MKLISDKFAKGIKKLYCFVAFLLIQFPLVGATIPMVEINIPEFQEQSSGERELVTLENQGDLAKEIGGRANKECIIVEKSEETIDWSKCSTGSDSEEEGATQYRSVHNSSKKRPLYRSNEKTNARISERLVWEKSRVDNYAKSREEILPATLASDAVAIHSVLEEDSRSYGATTILCVALLQKEDNDNGKDSIKKFAFSNSQLMGPNLRDKANQLGYHIIHAQQSHAEGVLLQFLQERPLGYTHLVSMGCSRLHCVECDVLLKLILGQGYTKITAAAVSDTEGVTGENAVDTKTYRRYYIPEALQNSIKKEGRNVTRARRNVTGARGNVTGARGNVTGARGNVTGARGNDTGARGNVTGETSQEG
ncbi:MAG: hypothetical protein MI674_05175 [Cytophagales bacterium]|nr:hypothetical protein [Cytophagales bacterium]